MKSISQLVVFASSAFLFSCASVSGPSGGNTTRAQFLDEVWVAPELKGRAVSEVFSKVYFAPVRTTSLERQGWWSSQSAVKQEQLQLDAAKLAREFHGMLNRAARNDPGRRLAVVSAPGVGTLTVEVAITELEPAKAYWNAGATAAGLVVPGAGLLSAAGSGSMTIEGRLRDGGTGKVIATFRDEMRDRMAVVNVDSYSWYGGSEKNLEEVAVKTARVLNAGADEVVASSAPIRLVAY
jgi:hypothetical protein